MYLKEIQGLRAVAALLVAIYHIWFNRVSGGVDAFFVISGFFLYRSLFAGGLPGWPDLWTYWRRTLARLVPAASVVILGTAALFYLLDADSLWLTQIKSGIAALFFAENWRLLANGQDYLAQDQLASPFQQFWALSVQLQVFALLPLLVVVLARIAARLPAPLARHGRNPAVIVAVIAVASFAYALAATHADQPRAYFNTAARVWEFAAGAFLASVLPRLSLAPGAARATGYLCLAILLGFAAIVPVGTSFPGAAALLPVLATAGIIIAAASGAGIVLLANRPMLALGDLSFAFYLWHWPLLIAWRLNSGEATPGIADGLAILAAAGLLSWLTIVLAERPFRQRSAALPGQALAFAACAAALVPAAAAVGLWGLGYLDRRSEAEAGLDAFRRGDLVAGLVPATVIAKSDVPVAYRDGCHQLFGESRVIECTYGNPQGEFVVALAGGSHSLQWLPALQEVARTTPSLRIVVMTKSSCPLTLSGADLALPYEANCLEWNRKVIARITALRPDFLVTLMTTTRETGTGTEIIPPGFRLAWAALPDLPVLALRDNPRAGFDVVDCIDRLGAEAAACRVVRRAAGAPEGGQGAELPGTVHPLDLTGAFCGTAFCEPVHEGVLVWRDRSHVTATFARVLAPRFRQALEGMGLPALP